MFQFSIKSLLGLVLTVAVVCTIFFALSIDVRYITLLVGVVALPAPLLVLYRQGRAFGRAFAFGGLVAYAVWLVLLGVPAGWIAASHFKDYSMWQLGSFYTLVPSYFVVSALYVPWLATLLGGLASLAVHRDCRFDTASIRASCQEESHYKERQDVGG